MYSNRFFCVRGQGKRRATGKRNHFSRPLHGFTLTEMMVVVVLIGLLAGAVTVGVRNYLIAGKQSVARMEIAKICQALDTFYTAYDRYPTNEEGIEVLAGPTDKFVDPLLRKMPVDPWGNAYQYNQPGVRGPYEVICFGADGQDGGEGADADFSNEDQQKPNDQNRSP